MTDKNNLGRIEYILTCIFWTLIANLWFKNLIFIHLDGYSVRVSGRILWIIIWISLVVGIAITLRRRRNHVSVAVNVMLPFEIYTVISYSCYYENRIRTILAVTLVFVAIYASLVLFRRITLRSIPRYTVVLKRVRHAFLGGVTLTAVCLCSLILPIGINALTGNAMYNTPPYTELGPDRHVAIYENIETVKKLDPAVWKSIGIEERIEVLSTVKDIELGYLGINHEVCLSADSLGEMILGCYSPREHEITVSVEHIKDSDPGHVLHTLAHECYHVYSYQLVDMYRELSDKYKNMPLFENAQTYGMEYADYVDGESDYYGYSNQQCELHADLYGDEAVEEYYLIIEKHNSKENSYE